MGFLSLDRILYHKNPSIIIMFKLSRLTTKMKTQLLDAFVRVATLCAIVALLSPSILFVQVDIAVCLVILLLYIWVVTKPLSYQLDTPTEPE